MRDLKFTPAQEQRLRDQAITAEQPGPVLHDVRRLLDVLGPNGVEAAGKYNLLPIKLIPELNRLLSRPIPLELKRPQIRSHPYLLGLNLLLRASGLTQVDRAGTKARLVLVPEMVEQWDRLNPTEQYFNLLEAWLRFGRAEMVGGRGPSWGDMLLSCLRAWESIPAKGLRFDTKRPLDVAVQGIDRDFYQLALMDLFGLIAVEPPRRPVAPWCPAAVRRVPFGDAVFTLLDSVEFGPPPEDGDPEEEAEGAEDEEEWEDDWLNEPQFGAWQPLFQPYFPEWRANLEFPRTEPREGLFVFRVSLGKIWRRIAIPAEATLDDLVGVILDSVGFDDDHLYEFTYRDRLGAEASISHPVLEEGPWTDQVRIGRLPLEPGQSMTLLYDFGDHWQFDVKLERVDPPAPRAKRPRILESHGEAPAQYPSWDD